MNVKSLSYSVTESIHRRYGRITKLIYDYEENQEQYELNLLTQKQDHISKYRAIVKRDEYERLIDVYMTDQDKLSFEDFVRIVRPIMMGTYVDDELRDAFSLLDRNQSNTIDIDEFSNFLSIIHSEITKEVLLHYLGEVGVITDQKLDFDQFTDVVLHGIGRDIICGHIYINRNDYSSNHVL